MKSIYRLLTCVLCFASLPVVAALTGVSVTPGTATLTTASNNSVLLSWSVSTNGAHTGGASSPNAQLFDVATGSPLGAAGMNLNQPGAGPFIFSDTLSLSVTQVRAWQSQGINQIDVRRSFSDVTGRMVTGSMRLTVPERGNITGASVSPLQSSLSATSNNAVMLNWRVTATATYTSGVTSTPAQLINPVNGQVIGSLGGGLNAMGSAPYNLPENLQITTGMVQSWQNQGITQVRVERQFSDAATGDLVQAAHVMLVPARANFSGARVSPAQRQIYANQATEIQLSWQVATGSGHVNGVVSAGARILNPASGSVLMNLGGVLSATGSGPFLFTESLSLNDLQMQALLASNNPRLVLERVFSDPLGGGSTRAYMTLQVHRSGLDAARSPTFGELQIRSLQLAFDTGNDQTLVDPEQKLTALLTLGYSGSGMLEGRWQLAEPGSTDGLPLFRTLTLVRQNIAGNQRLTLESPVLPTLRAGKYLLRFCVTNRNLIPEDGGGIDPTCPIDEWVIDASYQVQAQAVEKVITITGVSPNRQYVNSSTPFRWGVVGNVKVYQMQVFRLAPTGPLVSDTRALDDTSLEPQFVVGMVVPKTTTETPLSELVRSKLTPGDTYLWRVTAHDEHGRLLASSSNYSFVYQPEDKH